MYILLMYLLRVTSLTQDFRFNVWGECAVCGGMECGGGGWAKGGGVLRESTFSIFFFFQIMTQGL